MARIRTIKPDFFKHEQLFDAEREYGLPLRLAFSGIWTQCDREGRFRWRPRQLKTDILPYDDVDFSRVLDALSTRGFVVKYASQGEEFGYIPSWRKHQVINNRERPSDIPAPSSETIEATKEPDASSTREARVDDATRNLQSGREGERKGRGKEEDAADAALDPDFGSAPEAELFRRGKQVCGQNSGGLIRQVLAAKDKNVALARAAIEVAATKENPREYLGAIVQARARSANEDARARGDAW